VNPLYSTLEGPLQQLPEQTTQVGTQLRCFLARPLQYIRPCGSKCFAREGCVLRGLGFPPEPPGARLTGQLGLTSAG
jgi:hypothetical protein